jgi:hypothetical protein
LIFGLSEKLASELLHPLEVQIDDAGDSAAIIVFKSIQVACIA